jgi:hypothetical protein
MSKKTLDTWKNRITNHGEQPAKQFLAHELNARRHPGTQRDALRGSLNAVGWVAPVIVSARSGKILDGHARVEEALSKDENALVPFVEVDVSENEERTILATFDPITALATYEREALDALLREVDTGEAALQKLLTDLAQQEGLYREEADKQDAEPQPDKGAILNEKWQVKTGDLWHIGSHRLLCADSGEPRSLDILMDGAEYQVTVLDPPYELADHIWSRWIADPCILFGQMRHLLMVPRKLWRFERIVVKRYRHRSATVQIDHRHAFVAQIGSEKILPHNSMTFPSVIDQEIDRDHDHAKPVALVIEHLTYWTPPWEIVYDPYMGSGTTMVAAQNMGKRCYGVEMSPEYCAVILERMSAAFPDLEVKRG